MAFGYFAGNVVFLSFFLGALELIDIGLQVKFGLDSRLPSILEKMVQGCTSDCCNRRVWFWFKWVGRIRGRGSDMVVVGY